MAQAACLVEYVGPAKGVLSMPATLSGKGAGVLGFEPDEKWNGRRVEEFAERGNAEKFIKQFNTAAGGQIFRIPPDLLVEAEAQAFANVPIVKDLLQRVSDLEVAVAEIRRDSKVEAKKK